MLLSLSKIVPRICGSGISSLTIVRCYRLPVNFINYMDQYVKDFSEDKNETVVNSYNSIKAKVKEYEELESFKATAEDVELKDIASSDLVNITDFIDEEVNIIRDELVIGEKYDNENALMEVVPGAGGQEASMFAEEIFNFYISYCQDKGCQIEIVEETRTSLNKSSKSTANLGLTKGVVKILSDSSPVFRLMKYESGVHRVQRVPVTGTKNDRLQTSTCSVAVLPEPRNIIVNISDRDLKWDFMRASGAGGQGVNTADSAVRLTHLPTNIVVESQEERAQAQNKKRALKKLQNILYQQQWESEQKKVSSSRKLQIGNMNRNEKIRTYNFNRHMVTDHRVNKSETFPNINHWFSGQFGFGVIDNYREQLEDLDKEDQFLKLLSSKK